MDDAPITTEQLPPLQSEPWLPIDPSYKSVLRITVTLNLLIPIVGCIVVLLLNIEPLLLIVKIVLALCVSLVLVLCGIWIPRRVKRTEYLLRELDVHKRTGYWWHATSSAGNNRIQHIEVTQGPLERLYGLSKLVLYTAGGGQSDIKIPGLPSETAHRLKNYLTERITAEESIDAAEY
ncbi:PH domain-containing protein [Gilvimarinus sp. SDUM040013]|uniref:PH domain-containing protein n=1 Tax=Gilvimarinus gilvus TaxID=3058038 RepID=A0ABU4S0J3_9GAMM|nr:PH domain-containing protein [Gilvimarinus sp. SDUM040013]MDO3386350.1 PH domain-containing protein [Gilvimarinus sp. SDUM040013]MDX6849992.1 PH domain-containing protein [Gilvimarinus sp. SDUM040013]